MLSIFKNKKNINNLPKPNINDRKGLDFYLKPKKKNKLKPLIIFFSLVLIAVIVWIGANAYSAVNKIIDKNGSSAPFFGFLNGQASPDLLKGEGDGRINILLMGIGGENHPGGLLTDTIQIVSIDPNNKKIATLSLPRDLYVEVENYGGVKINQVYSIGEGDKEDYGSGAELMKKMVSDILDLPIHYYITMDFAGFVKIVDEVGGIDVNVEKELYDPYYPDEDMIGYAPFYIEAGQTHMNGSTALKYARSRMTSSDFDRSARQQQILVAMRQKIFDIGILTNPSKFSGILQILGDHLRTDIQLKEMERLATLLKEIDISTISSKVIDNSADGPLISHSNNGYYLITKTGDFSEIQRIAHEIFTDPYLQKENARLELLNGTNEAGIAKTASDTLISYGYNVVNLDKAEKIYSTTTLFDYSGGKFPYTVKFLSERYNAKVVSQPSSSSQEVDLSLVLGEDYLK